MDRPRSRSPVQVAATLQHPETTDRKPAYLARRAPPGPERPRGRPGLRGGSERGRPEKGRPERGRPGPRGGVVSNTPQHGPFRRPKPESRLRIDERRPRPESRLRIDDRPHERLSGTMYSDNVDGYQGLPGYDSGYPRELEQPLARQNVARSEVNKGRYLPPSTQRYPPEEQVEEYDYDGYVSPDEDFDGQPYEEMREVHHEVHHPRPRGFESAAQPRQGGFLTRGKFAVEYPDDKAGYPEDMPMPGETPDGRPAARPGDWTCTECMFSNFATRTECYKCKGEKGSAPETLSLVNWECTECFASNHERRFQCFKCQKPKPKNAKECGSLVDWTCDSCNSSNNARRTNCGRCDGARPGREKELDANPDWKCGGCGIMNWSWRESCYKCQGSKADGKVPEGTPENWDCTACGKNNWARRTQCFSCKAGKDGAEVPEDQQEWDCTACGKNNWASRTQCFSCKAGKDGAAVPEDQQEWDCSACGKNNWARRTQCFSCKADK